MFEQGNNGNLGGPLIAVIGFAIILVIAYNFAENYYRATVSSSFFILFLVGFLFWYLRDYLDDGT